MGQQSVGRGIRIRVNQIAKRYGQNCEARFQAWHCCLSEEKDKNGKEIYEGDLIEIPETDFNANIIGTIEYQEDRFFIQARNGGSPWGLQWSLRKHNAGILGNIHDNPELLKGGNNE